jgi:hypothetical protein
MRDVGPAPQRRPERHNSGRRGKSDASDKRESTSEKQVALLDLPSPHHSRDFPTRRSNGGFARAAFESFEYSTLEGKTKNNSYGAFCDDACCCACGILHDNDRPAWTWNTPQRDDGPTNLRGSARLHDRRSYLQPAPGQDIILPQRVRELQVLRSHFEGNIALLSDDPSGEVDAGLPLGQVRAGILKVGDTTADVILVRVDDPTSDKSWLVSKEEVAKIPELYAQMESEAATSADQVLPAAVTRPQLLGMSAAQWLGWLFSIPALWLLALLSTILLSAPKRIWSSLRKVPFTTIWQTPIGMPLKCVIAIVLHTVFVYKLNLPLFYRAHYLRFMAGFLAGCLVWLFSRIADRGFDRAVNQARLQRKGRESILIVVQRLTRVMMLIIGGGHCPSLIRVQREDNARRSWNRGIGDSTGRAKDA